MHGNEPGMPMRLRDGGGGARRNMTKYTTRSLVSRIAMVKQDTLFILKKGD